MGVSKNNGTPKSSISIGFSIIFTIHFGYPYFWKHPYDVFDDIFADIETDHQHMSFGSPLDLLIREGPDLIRRGPGPLLYVLGHHTTSGIPIALVVSPLF